MNSAFLDIRDLQTRIVSDRGDHAAVDGVSLVAARGEAVALIGESGSGKSLTALSAARLLPRHIRISSGSVWLEGEDILSASERRMREVRRSDLAMIFQDPASCLNPLLTIGEQIAEAATGRRSIRREAERARVFAALSAMRVSDPERVASSYPHELSGGLQQRAVIASALIRRPKLIIADEPTTALDATVQSEVLKLLSEACRMTGAAFLFISHDLAVVARLCQRVYIMYAGQIVEEGPTEAIFRAPRHPYTQALLDSILDPWQPSTELRQMGGAPPDISNLPAGCRFHPRCKYVFAPCADRPPELETVKAARAVRCWLPRSKITNSASAHG